MTTQIRVADAGDVEAVRDFAVEWLLPHYTSIGLPEFGESMVANYWDNYGQAVAIDEQRVLLAMDNGVVVGVAEFGDYEGELMLWKLYIDEAHRGAGIGRALIDRVIESAPAPTGSLLIEHAAENVATGAIYEHLGFQIAWIDEGGDTPGGTTVWRRKRFAPRT